MMEYANNLFRELELAPTLPAIRGLGFNLPDEQ